MINKKNVKYTRNTTKQGIEALDLAV